MGLMSRFGQHTKERTISMKLVVEFGPLVALFYSTSRCPTSTGTVNKSVTFWCVFMLVQLNKCVVVCGSDLQRGHIGDGCLSSSIMLKWYGVCDFVVLSVV